MTTATIKYNLSDMFEKEEFLRATKALDLALCLHKLTIMLRTKEKSEDVVGITKDEFYNVLDEYNIILDDLLS